MLSHAPPPPSHACNWKLPHSTVQFNFVFIKRGSWSRQFPLKLDLIQSIQIDMLSLISNRVNIWHFPPPKYQLIIHRSYQTSLTSVWIKNQVWIQIQPTLSDWNEPSVMNCVLTVPKHNKHAHNTELTRELLIDAGVAAIRAASLWRQQTNKHRKMKNQLMESDARYLFQRLTLM